MAEVSREMGAIPAWVAAQPDRRRGDHPLNSFAALGPLAERVIGGQRPQDVYAPLRAAAAGGGCVALLGVGLTAMTLIHLAEQVAGRELFVAWALLADGTRAPARVGSCSRGFESLAAALAPAEAVSAVGGSRWRVFGAERAVDLAAREISRRPGVTSCGDPACARCRDMIGRRPDRRCGLLALTSAIFSSPASHPAPASPGTRSCPLSANGQRKQTGALLA